MPSSDTTPSSSSSSAGRSTKQSKLSKTLVLKLSSKLLKRFPGIPPAPEPPAEDKSKASSPSSSSVAPAAAAASSADNASDAASTPVPQVEAQRRKGIPGPKPGSKRGLGQGADAMPKPRGKPGPKKKPRLEDGSIDPNARPAGSGTVSYHKLGPKANQGAINAGLRALDRTGKPCRKWERKSFNLKSFTGVVWQVPTWSAPPKPQAATIDEQQQQQTNGDKAVNGNGTPAGDADSKANNSVSAVESEKSNNGEGDSTPLPNNIASSPAPVAVA
ncbi:hypothetical protein AJ79_08854 [Helicocarpus griseus UAMH5409]|uniref:INO80 complex subunit Ies4 n=1 Tax=Helicocarpus griseus UAMH5409 TaxID=1447875 RepID=A0A2B7WPD6_9EURO|nr:hypothetical protein AJ79_08854 [Helicocarpus griseus UAMH5409]